MYYLTSDYNDKNILNKKYNKYPKAVKRIILYFLKLRGYCIKNIDKDYLIYLLNKKSKRIFKFIKKKKIKEICLATKLYEDKSFINKLESRYNIRVINGKSISNFLIMEILQYIYNELTINETDDEVAVLCNRANEYTITTLAQIAQKVKILHVITNMPNQFKNLEKALYENSGITINICNNYKKSLAKINTIINFDFTYEELNRYKIYKYAIVINLNEKIEVRSKAFEGINCFDYSLKLPTCYTNKVKELRGFDTKVLYESFIISKHRKIDLNIVKNDNIQILSLIGKNGDISKDEYERLVKNRKKHLTKSK